jgi:hypothetical protein
MICFDAFTRKNGSYICFLKGRLIPKFKMDYYWESGYFHMSDSICGAIYQGGGSNHSNHSNNCVNIQ